MSATLPFPPQSPAQSPALSAAQVSLSTSPAPLLDLLPPEERVRLSPLLTRVLLANADVLYWRNQRIEHVYFPIDAVGSLIAQSEDGEIVEAGLVGREGVVGLPLFLGRESGPQQAVCQVPGEAWRMHAADFCRTVAQPSTA